MFRTKHLFLNQNKTPEFDLQRRAGGRKVRER